MYPPFKRAARLHRQTGFSLVELMVAMVLGLVLIGGVMSVFMTSKSMVGSTETLARMQDNGRVALTLLSRDLFAAGQLPCPGVPVANVIRSSDSTPQWSDWGAGVVQGIDKEKDVPDLAAFGTGNNDRVRGTDAILVLKGSDQVRQIAGHDPTATTLTLNSVDKLDPQDVVLVCDKQSGVIVQVNSVNTPAKSLTYGKSASNMNCGNGLGYPTTTSCDARKQFDEATGQLTPLESTVWYVGHSLEAPTYSLFRTYIKKTNGKITMYPDEVVMDVGSLAIKYLTKNTETGILNSDWLSADNLLFSESNHGWSEQNGQAQVVAVRLELTLLGTDKPAAGMPPLQRKLVQVIRLRNRNSTFQAIDENR